MVSFQYGLGVGMGLELESSSPTCKASCLRKKLSGTVMDFSVIVLSLNHQSYFT